MSQSTIDIVVRTRGERELDRLQTNMRRLEGEAQRLRGTMPAAANGIRQTGRAAATATGNVQRFGIAFRSTVAPIVAAYGAINFFNRSLSVMADRERDVEILANGLRNVGAQAGQLERLQRIASRLGEQTLFNQEDFTQGFALLTSFRNIGVASYERVSQAAADMATVTRTGVRESLLQLSKALENPVEGMSALSRSGTTFTAAQKAVVKSLVESNRQLEAQEYLLRIVEGQYKGASTEAAKGFAGQMDTLNETFRDFQEVVGKGVLPIVTELVKGMTDTFRVLSQVDPQLLTAAGSAAVFAAKLLLVNKAIKAMLGFRLAIATMLTGTARNMTLTGVAAGRATPLIKAMATALRNLAAIGIVTVGVDYIVNGFSQRGTESAERGRLQRELEGGSINAFAGASRESVQEVREQAQATITAAQEELARGRSLLGRTAQTLIPDFARYLFGQPGGLTGTRENILEGRIRVAQQRLEQLDPSQFQTEEQLFESNLPDPDAPTGGGGSATDTLQQQMQAGQELSRQFQQQIELLNTKNQLQQELLDLQFKEEESIKRIQETAAASQQADLIKNQQLLTQLETYKAIDEYVKGQISSAEQLVASTAQMLADDQRRTELIAEGLTPALADAYVNIENQFNAQRKVLDATLLTLETELARVDANSEVAKKIQEQINKIKELRGELDKGEGQQKDRADGEASNKIQDYINRLNEELNDTEGQIVRMAQTIETELGSAMSSAITGVITGTQTVEEAFSQMFANIGKAFIDMATEMIAKALIMQALGILTGGAGGGGGGGGLAGFGIGGTLAGEGVFTGGGPFQFRAEGGPVSAGQPYVVGEKGPELFVPGSGGNVVPNDMFEATRNALGGGGGGSAAFDENREAMNNVTTIERERQLERLISSGAGSTEIRYSRVGSGDLPFVTEDNMLQATRIAAQEGARLGQARTLAALKNNPGTRRSVGI